MTPINKQDLSSYSDEELMQFFQKGINAAFNEIVCRYQEKLYYWLFSHVPDKQDCEDMIQDTFLRVSRAKHTYSGNYKFSSWLYAIAKNLMLTYYGRKSRSETIKLIDDPVDPQLQPDVWLNYSNMVSTTREAIADLSPQFSLVLTLRIVDECSYREINELTGLPIGTIKSRIGRGRARLRKKMKRYKDS